MPGSQHFPLQRPYLDRGDPPQLGMIQNLDLARMLWHRLGQKSLDVDADDLLALGIDYSVEVALNVAPRQPGCPVSGTR